MPQFFIFFDVNFFSHISQKKLKYFFWGGQKISETTKAPATSEHVHYYDSRDYGAPH